MLTRQVENADRDAADDWAFEKVIWDSYDPGGHLYN